MCVLVCTDVCLSVCPGLSPYVSETGVCVCVCEGLSLWLSVCALLYICACEDQFESQTLRVWLVFTFSFRCLKVNNWIELKIGFMSRLGSKLVRTTTLSNSPNRSGAHATRLFSPPHFCPVDVIKTTQGVSDEGVLKISSPANTDSRTS